MPQSLILGAGYYLLALYINFAGYGDFTLRLGFKHALRPEMFIAGEKGL